MNGNEEEEVTGVEDGMIQVQDEYEEEEDVEAEDMDNQVSYYSESAIEFLERPDPVNVKYDVSYSVEIEKSKETKELLHRAVGEANAGDLMAIMGPSGAGKSSLLRVLSGRVAHYEGSVLFNSKRLDDVGNDHQTSLSCFVQQEDLFIASMTPREHLMFSAKLRIDKSVSQEDRTRRVNSLITELGLDKCADTPIGGEGIMVKGRISGGERKRLSLATEILPNPSVIFVDEPTSGLDSYMAEAVVAKLGRLAENGHTILATIHQPSSYVFSAFHKVHLLANGHTAYSGTTDGAVEYFEQIDMPLPPMTNPADYYLKVLSIPDDSVEAIDAWERSSRFKKLDMMSNDQVVGTAGRNMSVIKIFQKQDYPASWWTQCIQLMKRTIVEYKRNATLGRMRLAQAVVLAILVGLVYIQLGKSPIKPQNFQSVNGALFFAVLNQGILGTLGVLQVFPLEKPVFLREASAHAYSPSAYFMGKSFAELPFQVIFPWIFATILYFFLGFANRGAAAYFTFMLFIILTAMSAISLGYFVGSMVPNVGVALALGPLCLMPLVIFGGLLINVDDIDPWFVWLSYLSFIRYGYEGVMIVIWEDEPAGQEVLDQFSWSVDHKWRNVGCLCALIVGFRSIAMVSLKMQSLDKTKMS